MSTSLVTRLLEERRTAMQAAEERHEPSKLLTLPLEIRHQIYKYLLPHTGAVWTIFGNRAFVWHRGSCAVLAVNKQINTEAASVMYGESMFVVEVEFDNIIFRPRLMLRTGTTSPATPNFLDTVRDQNLKRVRYLAINVHHVDSYTGMIKYNYGGDGLTEGLRAQVQKLVDAISTATELRRIRVHMDGGNGDPVAAQRILEPFAQLRNIQGQVIVDGGATDSFRTELEAAMMNKPRTEIET